MESALAECVGWGGGQERPQADGLVFQGLGPPSQEASAGLGAFPSDGDSGGSSQA